MSKLRRLLLLSHTPRHSRTLTLARFLCSSPSSSPPPIKPVSHPIKSKDPEPQQSQLQSQQSKPPSPLRSPLSPLYDMPLNREDARFEKYAPGIWPVSYPSRVAPLPEHRKEEDDEEEGDEAVTREGRRIERGEGRVRSYFGLQEGEERILFPTTIKQEKRTQKVVMDLSAASREGKVDQADDHVPQGLLRKRGIGKNVSAVDKRKFLINTLMDLKDSKEAVYGTLDAWVAWEHNFPLVSLKRALLILQKEEQWHRVVQVIKWMLSKGQGTTMGTYEQLICALEKDNRAEEAHQMWVKKINHDLHSVPWTFCALMISIYYRNNMLNRLVKLFKGLESYERRPPNKSIVKKVADAYEMLGILEEKNRILEKYSDLFSDAPKGRFKKSRKDSQKNQHKSGKEKNKVNEANKNVEVDSGPSDEESVNIL